MAKQEHKELPFNMMVRILTGAVAYVVIYIILVSVLGSDFAATVGAGAVSLGTMLACECSM